MKSARRHELKKNALDTWLTEHLHGLEEHKNTIVTLVIAGIAAIVIGAFLLTGGDPRAAADWETLYESYATTNRTRDLEKITKTNPRPTAAVLWAKKSLADEQLREGSEKLFIDRQDANDLLEKAAKNYSEVEQKASGQPALVAQALVGLGRVNESQGNIEKAKKNFAQAIVVGGKDSVFGKIAAESIKRLSDPRTEELLAWFQEQKPKPPKSQLGLTPGSGLDPLPDRPDIGFSGTPFKNPKKSVSEGAAKEDAQPEKNDGEPPLENPANEKPTDSKSKEPAPEKPESDKPADAKPDEPQAGKSAEKSSDKPADKQP